MSKENFYGGCQQRYKGIENFLRRVAFNLGNTPSETEVKIISCIPIDVTDLQQKIVELEKQLEKTEDPKCSKPNCVVTNQAICTNQSSRHSSISIHLDCPAQAKKSAISFLYPTDPRQNCNIIDRGSNNGRNGSMNKQEKYSHPKKSFFTKKKSRTTKKKICKTEIVYYATPDTKTPFNNFVFADDATSKNACREEFTDCNDDQDYLSHILNKQYMHRPALNVLSDASEFSSPICRDEATTCRAGRYESDVCSCCHGPFQNLDRHMTSPAHILFPSDLYPTFTDKENDNKYAYYDSRAYDVIPVKENKFYSVEDFDVLSRRDMRRHINMECWPESVRPKNGCCGKVPAVVREPVSNRRKQRVIVNYHTVVPYRNNLNIKSNKINIKKDLILNKMAANRPIMTHSNLNRKSQDPTICKVDFGEVYAKRNRQFSSTKPIRLHNVSCSTTVLNNSECQTGLETTESLVDDKTAATLNQIKTILQSVLTEVKTKTKLASHPEPKKDAAVQECLSHSNIICGGSHLLNSFTYSHFNTKPYIASCSRHMPLNSFCPANVPYSGAKCIQQYPLFVQPNRHLCSTCCGNNHPAKQLLTTPSMKPGVTTATNTDQTRERSKETQKLIKEIYDSIALNIEIPIKDTNLNQGDQITNSKAYMLKENSEKEMKQRDHLISEIFKNPNPLNTSVTEKLTPVSKLTSDDTTFRSEYNNKAPPITKHTVNKNYSDNTTITADTEVDNQADSDEESDDTAINEDDATDSTASDVDDAVPVATKQSSKKQERNGIFSKMVKLFTPKNKRQTKKTINEQNDSESDSDDYQTIYSQKIAARPKKEVRKVVHEVRHVHRPLPTKVIHSKHERVKQQSPERYKRTPYMEQEYRRYWDEKLLFQNRYAKHSTEASRITTPEAMTRPVYYQNYETRSAFVEPNGHVATSGMYVHRGPARKSSYVTNRTTGNRPRAASKGLAWLKKHKLG